MARYLIALVIVTALLIGIGDPWTWHKALSNLARLIGEISVDVEVLDEAFYAMIDTVLLSIFATSAGALASMLLGALSSPLFISRYLAVLVRALANFMRTIPALIWGILAVIMFGPGTVAGAIALTIYTTGYLTKLFYETYENVDRDLVDSLRVFGVKGLTLAAAVFRQMKKQVVTNILFIFEYNIRTATILGIVGAGGVGYYIAQYMTLLNYSAVFTIIMVAFIFVGVVDLASYIVRRFFV